jgi:phage FluMu gp28-like protein
MHREIEEEEMKGKPLVPADIVEFCKNVLGFTPTDYQEKLLLDESQFVVARWARQTGKSTTIAALALHHALLMGVRRIVILAPSLRQGKKLLQRIGFFASRVGWVLVGRVLKTKLEFVNGSTIEALPNSPETIRGDTTSLIIIDEMGYVQGDKELYDAGVYSLSTTNGRFIASSTPGSRNTLFYAMCCDDDLYGHFSRHHVSYEQALEPHGPLKREIVEEIRRQMKGDVWRWQREMLAEFAEDDDCWLSLALITECVAQDLAPFKDELVLNGQLSMVGDFYIGCDLGQKRDPSVIVVVEKGDHEVRVVHLKKFRLDTPYGSVMGYLKLLSESLQSVRRIFIDQTGVGQVFVDMVVKSGLKNVKGITLTLPEKQQVMVYLKQRMEDGRLQIPYDSQLINEMNVERSELTQTGHLQFSHPSGTHDDMLWAVALGVYSTRYEPVSFKPFAAVGKSPSSFRHLAPNLDRRMLRGEYVPWTSPVTNDPPGAPSRNGWIICMSCGNHNPPGIECICKQHQRGVDTA